MQHYDWGGFDYIARLLGQENTNQQPWAEYWLGIHPKGVASVSVQQSEQALDQFLIDHKEVLGDRVLEQFDSLPFLFKILDVRNMLSIQLHPTKAKAKLGFAKEEALGIDRLAFNRNYKDQNHKPEVMVALTDFWLLHAFRSVAAIERVLLSVEAWSPLLVYLKEGGIVALYKYVMSIAQQQVNELLQPLWDRLQKQELHDKSSPDYWAKKAFESYTRKGNYDRGIFSIYFFNLVFLKEGQAIFQDAGIPHAYLEGVNIELMANSDNVLRGGLTPKHIDVEELLDNIKAEAKEATILEGQALANGFVDYEVPINDFALAKLNLVQGQSLKLTENGAAIYLVIKGTLQANDQHYTAGDSFLVADQSQLSLKNENIEAVELYKAYTKL